MTRAVPSPSPACPAAAPSASTAPTSVAATLTIKAAGDADWPIVIIGAGVGGGLAALTLARAGYRVLLIEKQTLPRHKTCGGCLNAAALATLRQVDAVDLLDDLDAPMVNALHLHHRGRRVAVSLPVGRAVSRWALDAAVVERAIAAGAAYLDQTTAELAPADSASTNAASTNAASTGRSATVLLRRGAIERRVRASCVLAADGLAGRALQQVTAPARVRAGARIGVGTVVEDAHAPSLPTGAIRMHCGPGGYVGITRVERNRIAIAAALEPAAVQQAGGPAGAVQRICQHALGRGWLDRTDSDAGLWAIIADGSVRWRGVPALTRHRPQPAGCRWFALGDAAGYVEPFTGEGMAWAMSAALAVQPLVERAVDHWTDDLAEQWSRTVRDHRRRGQRTCRWIARTLRYRWTTTVAMALLARRPALADRVVGRGREPVVEYG